MSTSATLDDRRPRRITMGRLPIDCLTFAEALEAIERLVAGGRGGSVFTPNVDHVVRADNDDHFAALYANVDVSLADGTPVVWASRLMGTRLPAKVSGSDLVEPLMGVAARNGWRVYFLGGAPGAAAEAHRRLRERLPLLQVVGIDAPKADADGALMNEAEVLGRIRAAAPDLILVALGSPKQERWIGRYRESLGPTVAVGVGVSLEFLAGYVQRAPRWMQLAGLEWLHRLCQEPGRLWKRYFLRDPFFVWIILRQMLTGRARVNDGISRTRAGAGNGPLPSPEPGAFQ